MAYTTNTELKTYKSITGTADDTLLTTLITRAQKFIEMDTGRVFEAAADSTRYLPMDLVIGDTLFLDRDLCAITKIYTNADNGTGGVEIPSSEYTTLPRNETPYYAIRIKASSTKSWEYTDDPADGIKIEGRWAYATTAPADIVQACTRLAAYFYAQKDAGVFDVTAMPDAGMLTVPQGIPKDVRAILDKYRRNL